MQKLLEEARHYVTEIFTQEVSPAYIYHDLDHTLQVEAAAKAIAEGSGLSPDEVSIVQVAALFHDLGYKKHHLGHEATGAQLVEEFLEGTVVSRAHIENIQGAIMSTNVYVKPKDIYQEILCDADLSYLGMDGYFERAEVLRKEWEDTLELVYSDSDWFTLNVQFFSGHEYYTSYARTTYNPTKGKHLKILERRVAAMNK